MAYSIVQTNNPGPGIGFLEEQSSQVGAVVMAMAWQVNRGATNTQLVGTLPANARVVRIDISVTVVSNAATTATVSVGKSGGSAVHFCTAQDVKAAIGNFSQAATALGWGQSANSTPVTCTYTETGTASTAGTAYVTMYYIAA